MHEIENHGSDDVERDKCGKEGEILSPASIPKNEEQREILYEAGRPEQEIKTCQLHVLELPSRRPLEIALEGILRQAQVGKNHLHHPRLRVGTG
jgi:hypothetical protein